jgi:quercetin dioxygenase-like cupin family protein
MELWDLTDPALRGVRDPQVLIADDGARAILIAFEAGQALDEHETRENAWGMVIEGELLVTDSNGKEQRLETGGFVRWTAGERRSLAALTEARLLLILTPWPAKDHYAAGERELLARSG